MTEGATLIDGLTGEQVPIEGGASAADVIALRVAAADHPRADFRARPLQYELVDASADRSLAAEEVVAAGSTVRLSAEGATDIWERRNRWLADIEERGEATVSVSAATHLALVERTKSRLEDVHRLRARLAEQRAAVPPPRRGGAPGQRWMLVGALAAVVVVAGAVWYAVGRSEGETAAGERPGPAGAVLADGELVALPFELEAELELGQLDEVEFSATEGQAVSIFMFAPANRFGPSLDPVLRVLDADGNEVGYNDDRMDVTGVQPPGFNSLNSRIDLTIPADGTYTVVAGDLGDDNGGSYRLLIEEGGPGGDGFNGAGGRDGGGFVETTIVVEGSEELRPADLGCGRGEIIEVELPFDGPIDAGCELAALAFTVTGRSDLAVWATARDADPIVWLLDDDGEVIAYNDDTAGLDSFFEVAIESGSYEVLVGNLQESVVSIGVTIEVTSTG